MYLFNLFHTIYFSFIFASYSLTIYIRTNRTNYTPIQFGNAGTPKHPVVIDSNEDEDIMRAVEESLRINSAKPSTNASIPSNTSEKNPFTSSTTTPNLIQYISSTHPSTPSTISPRTTTTAISPRGTTTLPQVNTTFTTTTSSVTPVVDGLASMLDDLHISTERSNKKNNKSNNTTTSRQNNITHNITHHTINNPGGNSGDVGRSVTTATATMNPIIDAGNTFTHPIASTRTAPQGRKILKPRKSPSRLVPSPFPLSLPFPSPFPLRFPLPPSLLA